MDEHCKSQLILKRYLQRTDLRLAMKDYKIPECMELSRDLYYPVHFFLGLSKPSLMCHFYISSIAMHASCSSTLGCLIEVIKLTTEQLLQ